MPRASASSCSSPFGRPAEGGRAFVYVLPCHGEDLLKIGFSRDPLGRLQQLHRRWYELFDLDAGWLLECDRVREARDFELRLRAPLAGLQAPPPLTVEPAAGGHTEWFRGALQPLDAVRNELAASGHRVHRPLADWLRPAAAAHGDRLLHWSDQMLQALEQARYLGAPAAQLRGLEATLRDTLDAWPALGLALDERLSPAVADWYRGR